MNIEYNYVKRQSIQEFAEEHGLTMVVNERSDATLAWNPKLPRYTASFKGVEIIRDGFLISNFGNGNSPEEAIADYAKKISEKQLTFDCGKTRLWAPSLH